MSNTGRYGINQYGESGYGTGQLTPFGTFTEASLDFVFNVNTISIIGHLNSKQIFNQFDEFGLLLGLDRLPGEKSAPYKQRLLDVFAHRANSTYRGMINGITREFGLSQFNAFRIRPRISGSVFIAENPVVIFNGPFIELWRDKENSILEMEINRFDQNGSAYLIKDLYNFINNNSTYFICDSLNTQMQDLKSMTILNQSNQLLIASEIIPIANRFTLSNPDVDNGVIINKSLFFTDSITFANQVNAINNINTLGDYYINVYTGDIATFAPPQINTLVRYRYINYNRSYMIGSPIILGALNDVNYLRIMFEQILGDDGKFYNGLPSIYGTDKINELLSVYPLYFGK